MDTVSTLISPPHNIFSSDTCFSMHVAAFYGSCITSLVYVYLMMVVVGVFQRGGPRCLMPTAMTLSGRFLYTRELLYHLIILGKMLSWGDEKSYSITIWDNVTKAVPLCWVYKEPSYEVIITLLAPFPTDLAYLSMLFILHMACTAGNTGGIKNK